MLNLFFSGILLFNVNNLALVKTEIKTTVNGVETNVTSEEEGTLKVTNINGETTIEKNNNQVLASPELKINLNSSSSTSPSGIKIAEGRSEIESNKFLIFARNTFFKIYEFIFGKKFIFRS